MKLISINPATNKKIRSYKKMNAREIEKTVQQAQQTYVLWKKKSYAERSVVLKKIANYLKKNKNKYAKLITAEMGKPLTQSISEVEKCAFACEFYANNIEELLKQEPIKTESQKTYVRFDPLGVILAVMPWNFPFWQVFRAAVPAIMAGNTVVLKHASNVSGCSLAIQEIFSEFQKGLISSLLISSDKVKDIIADDRIIATTVTGSDAAGRAVASQSGAALKKTILELGGSDAFIVLKDADVELASSVGVTARFQNGGQSCIAAKRFILEKPIAEAFLSLFQKKINMLKIGDPMDVSTEIGPMARLDLAEQIEKQVNECVKKGAQVLVGGKRISKKSCFYMPTILTHINKKMSAWNEEFFGPIALIIVVKDEKEAITVANDTPFGLSSSLWTRDIKKAEKLASYIEAGAVFINDMSKSDSRVPFGGIKKSGFGRELGAYGIREFVNIKAVIIK